METKKKVREHSVVLPLHTVRRVLAGARQFRLPVRKPRPWVQPGDRLWVREPWALVSPEGFAAEGWAELHRERALTYHPDANEVDGVAAAVYKADGETVANHPPLAWRSPAVMPRWASRLLLTVVEVRTERLQAITKGDIMASGIEYRQTMFGLGFKTPEGWYTSARFAFECHWNREHGAAGYRWTDDPEVWVVVFERVEPIAFDATGFTINNV